MPPGEFRRILVGRPILWFAPGAADGPGLCRAVAALADSGGLAMIVDAGPEPSPTLRAALDGRGVRRSGEDPALRYVTLEPGAALASTAIAELLGERALLSVGPVDPRLLDWRAGHDAGAEEALPTWLALLGEGVEGGAPSLPAIVAEPEQITRWFEARVPAGLDGPGELVIYVEVLADRWILRAGGGVRELAGGSSDLAGPRPVLVDATDDDALAELLARARTCGAGLSALLPAPARERLAELVDAGEGLIRLRVKERGGDERSALRLPWELLTCAGRFVIAEAGLELVREQVVSGARSLSEAPGGSSVIAQVAAPLVVGEADAGVELVDRAAAEARVSLSLAPLGVRRVDSGRLQALQELSDGRSPTLAKIVAASEGGQLLFEARYGDPDPISARELARAVDGRGQLDALWLELHERGESDGSLALLPAELHRCDVPEILAVPGGLPEHLAARVDAAVVAGLRETGSLREGVSRARRAIAEPFEIDGEPWRLALAWSLPQLYHRGPRWILADPEAEPRVEAEPRSAELGPGLDAPVAFVGRRRLLQTLGRARIGDGVQALGLCGPPGLGKATTLVEFAALLLGRGALRQRLLAVALDARGSAEACAPGFAGLRQRIAASIRAHRACPEDWEQRLAAVDAAAAPGPALAEALFAVGRGRKAVMITGLERLLAGEDEPAWIDEASAGFCERILSEVPKGATVLSSSRRRPPGGAGRWWTLPPFAVGEALELAARLPALGRSSVEERRSLSERELSPAQIIALDRRLAAAGPDASLAGLLDELEAARRG